jgi:hypothetical protein
MLFFSLSFRKGLIRKIRVNQPGKWNCIQVIYFFEMITI